MIKLDSFLGDPVWIVPATISAVMQVNGGAVHVVLTNGTSHALHGELDAVVAVIQRALGAGGQKP